MKGNAKTRPSQVATVELDRDALQRLENARSAGETVSDVIKRCIRPRQSAKEILRSMRQAPISPKSLQAMDRSANRHRQRAFKPKS